MLLKNTDYLSGVHPHGCQDTCKQVVIVQYSKAAKCFQQWVGQLNHILTVFFSRDES